MLHVSPSSPASMPDVRRAPNAGEPLELYLVLEGGGAKGGIGHIATLHAIEEAENEHKLLPQDQLRWPRLNVRGLAGTSIGAAIAALKAAGYTADEIIGLDGNQRLAQKYSLEHLDQLLGPGGWQKLKRARNFLPEQNRVRLKAAHEVARFIALRLFWAVALTVGVTALLFAFLFSYALSTGTAVVDAVYQVFYALANQWPLLALLGLAATAVGFSAFLFLSIRRLLKGLLKTDNIRNHIQKALYDKLISTKRRALESAQASSDSNAALIARLATDLDDLERDQTVRFRQLPISLRIVATDVASRRLRVFSRRLTPEISVADAVAASIALPVLFQEVRIGDGRYYDGGLVSNSPVWVYDALRTLESDTYVVAIQMIPDPTKKLEDREKLSGVPRALQPFATLLSTLHTGIFGTRNIHVRPHDRLAEISVETQIGFLDFHFSGPPLQRAMQRAYHTARLNLADHFCNIPRCYEQCCEAFAASLIAQRRREPHHEIDSDQEPAPAGVIRIVIAKPSADIDCLRIAYGRAYSDFSNVIAQGQTMLDDRILLPYESTLAGRSFVSGRDEYAEGTTLEVLTFNNLPRDRYRKAMKDQATKDCPIAWRWAIPVYADGRADPRRYQASFVVCIESNLPPDQFPSGSAEVRKTQIDFYTRQAYEILIAQLKEDEAPVAAFLDQLRMQTDISKS